MFNLKLKFNPFIWICTGTPLKNYENDFKRLNKFVNLNSKLYQRMNCIIDIFNVKDKNAKKDIQLNNEQKKEMEKLQRV